MTVTREQWEQGMTYDAYKAQMTSNRDRLEATEQTVELAADDIAYFRQLPHALPVLVLAEDWCGDVIANLPVLAKLATATDRLDLRILLRDQHLDIMDQYLNGGVHRSIPVFVFFDHDFRELGHWIERPARMTELQQNLLDDLFANDPAMAGVARDMSPGLMPETARTRLMQARGAFRAETRATSDREVVHEIRVLVSSALPSA